MHIEVNAEIGSNWNGDIEVAKKIILECKEAGADGVKFQIWRAKDLYSPSHKYWNFIQKSELKEEQIKELFGYSKSAGLDWFASIFYPEAVDILEELGVKFYKIASRTCTLKDDGARETLEAVAKTRKPVLISMGEGGDNRLIRSIFKHNDVTFMYVISEYPTLEEKIDWAEAKKYNAFSDHTLGNTASIAFCVLKALDAPTKIVIERHVRSNDSKGPDAPISISIDLLKDLVTHARKIEKMTSLKISK